MSCRPSCALRVGTQRTKRLELVLYICGDIRFLYVHGEMMYLFVYVPVVGRIAPAAARNRIGPLSVPSTSKGGPVRARGCHWERCGSTLLHITSAIRVEAPGLDPTYPK